MEKDILKTSIVFFASLLWLILSVKITHASAITPESGEKAVEIAQKIEKENLYLTDHWLEDNLKRQDLTAQRRLMLLRHQFWYHLSMLSDTKLLTLADQYLAEAKKYGNARDQKIGYMFQDFANQYSKASLKKTNSENLALILPYLKSKDWFVAHHAHLLMTQLDDELSNPYLALENSKKAFQFIPSEDSHYVNEAKIASYEAMAYLYNYLKNPELAIENTESLIKLAKQESLPVNGFFLINNFMYSFGSWRDLKTMEALATVLLKLQQSNSPSVPGLIEMRLTRIYNLQADYKNALIHANRALDAAQSPTIITSAQLNIIIAQAGLGKNRLAEIGLNNFINAQTKDGKTLPVKYSKHINYARALIALNNGDKDGARRFFSARLDNYVQDILTANNSDTASMLAALQNSKERQSEREDAILREAHLKDIAIEEQKTVNHLLSVMTLIFAVAAIAAFMFARYRTQTSKTLAVAAKKAQAGDKAKTEFLAVASHELRTPLNGIIGLSDMMRQSVKDPDIREKNQLVYKSGMDLLHVVENILEMTQIESGEAKIYAEPLDIHAVTNMIARNWKEDIELENNQTGKNIIFTHHIDDSVPETVEIDGRRLKQCLNNLLSNAAKFTTSGRIHLHVNAGKPNDNKVMEVTFIVADTGIGIKPEILPELLKPFAQADSSRTREHGGTGLGLTITYSLAQMMGGDINVISKTGRGTEFTLTLPVRQIGHMKQILPVKTAGNTAVPTNSSAFQTKKRVSALLVEDNIGNQNVVKSGLSSIEAQITIAENGQQALDLLDTQGFDLILMDVNLPDIDGITVTQKIRLSGKAYQDIPIIILTANVDPATQAKSILAGGNLFMSKPIIASELVDAIWFTLGVDSGRHKTADKTTKAKPIRPTLRTG